MEQLIDKYKDMVEPLAKGLALLAVVTYILGYMVITIRDAGFGFAAGSDLLKPRIMATGILFLVLLILPLYAAHKTLPDPYLSAPEIKDQLSLLRLSFTLVGYWSEIFFFSLLKGLILESDLVKATTTRANTYVAVTTVILFLIYSIVLFYFRDTPGRARLTRYRHLLTVLAFLLFALTVYLNLSEAAEANAAMESWFLIAGLFGSWAYRSVRSGNVNLKRSVLLLAGSLLSITFYSDMLYPHMYQKWGGGHAVPIAIALLDKASGKSSSLIRAELLDQDSTGSYVQYSSSEVAIFVPKDSISRMCFLARDQPHGVQELLLPNLFRPRNPKDGTSGCEP